MRTTGLTKKLICLLLVVQMIGGMLSAGVFADGDSAIDPSWIRVSDGKPVFASSFTDSGDPGLAIDRNSSTSFVSAKQNSSAETEAAYEVVPERFVLDLMSETNVTAVKILSSKTDNYKIYLSNDNTFITVKNIYDGEVTNSDFTVVTNSSSTKYRYVVVEMASGSGISEIEVYSDAANEVSMNVLRYSMGKTAVSAGDYKTYGEASKLVQQGYSDKVLNYITQNGSPQFVYVDLGAEVEIPYVTVSSGRGRLNDEDGNFDNWLTQFGNFSIMATNDPADFSAGTGAVLYSTTTSLVSETRHKMHTGMVLLESDKDLAGQKFRYVGIKGNARFQVASFTAYVSGTLVENLTGTISGNSVNISGKITEVDGNVTSDTILVSAFNSDGKSIGTKAFTQSISGKETATVSQSVTFNEAPAYVKLWIIDGLSEFRLKHVNTDLTSGGATVPTPTHTSDKNMEVLKDGGNVYVYGKAKSDNVTVVVLKPGVDGNTMEFSNLSESNYDDNVIFTDVRKLSAGDNYEFNMTLTDNDPVGNYRIKLFYGDGTSETENTFYYFSATKDEELTQKLGDAAADGVLGIIGDDEYELAFADVKAEIEKCLDSENGNAFSSDDNNFGDWFVMARDLMKSGEFSGSAETFTNYAQFKDVVIFASMLDSLAERDDYMDYIESSDNYRTKFMGEVFDDSYNKDKFSALYSFVRTKMKSARSTAVFSDSDDFVKAVKETIAMGLIYNGSQNNIAKAITDYPEYIGLSSDTISKSGCTAFEIANYISKTQTSVKGYIDNGIQTEVDNAIGKVKENKKQHTTGTLGGSGGGGGGKVSGESNVTYPPEAVTPPTETVENTVSFSDLAGYEWAEDAIKNLASKKIILGDENGNFNPGNNITREEIVKLVVDMFKITTSKADDDFEDCDVNEWYYPYVMAAKYNNVVKGITTERFGIGESVTRQDLATIMRRAMTYAGYDFGGKNASSFNDEDSIDLYAIDAVIVLAKDGIITGFEDGSFGPMQNATRAEAAVMVNRVYENYARQQVEKAAKAAAEEE